MTVQPAWDWIDEVKYRDEETAVRELLERRPLNDSDSERVSREAAALVEAVRAMPRSAGKMEVFLSEYPLTAQEGLALMCLAEALLRIPDPATRDRLIAEKIGSADWASHKGRSDELFVNASTWALMLTGKLADVEERAKDDPKAWLARLASRLGEPVVRAALTAAVGFMASQFVLGRTIGDALRRARREDLLCSFDMLGEGARTEADAERYEQLYAAAIKAIGDSAPIADPELRHGASIKLSALTPRFEAVQPGRLRDELQPRLRRLAKLAADRNIGLTIDAEEADRLVITLDQLSGLLADNALAGWDGLGIAVQAYQKRAPLVIAGLEQLARTSQRRLMVRLVKGAYWDSEIKHAQQAGVPDYPVWSTKAATDLAYLACARRLIAAAPLLYPQFATHNAHTLAAIRQMAAEAGVKVEFQRLHGMGAPLYAAAEKQYGPMRVRTYAPVGGHEELLPYLVRRLLENGANSSFVHDLLDNGLSAQELARDPFRELAGRSLLRHPALPPPPDLYGSTRRNPEGRDLSMAADRERLSSSIESILARRMRGGPVVHSIITRPPLRPILNPADENCLIGETADALPEDIVAAIRLATDAQPGWDRMGGAARATVLRSMGDALEASMDHLSALITLEAGKTLADSVSEVREAVDFCRYYATLAEDQFERPVRLPGPVGERNELTLGGRGVFASISPWNFPLAIFTGQIAAALAAGNAVLAKPAEQTPLIATEAVRLFHGAGLDSALLALLPGPGETVGQTLVQHPAIAGVTFTGGTETARAINRALAHRSGPIIPFIAETGGVNALFADSSALREQLVDDSITSAFGSAGQRCSALRVLFLPEETADQMIEALAGRLATLRVGNPADPATDVGPVIDKDALQKLRTHAARLQKAHRVIAVQDRDLPHHGYFFPPMIAEIDGPDALPEEIFGPILHICRYRQADVRETAAAFARLGYGLTLGIHSRIDSFVDDIRSSVPVGNVYVNRSMIGAVVGVQPFGGSGLSGTGPKAGGPYSLLRYAVERATSDNIAARGGDPTLLNLS